MTEPPYPRTVDEVIRRVDEGWSSFRSAVAALSDDGWEAEVPGGGWTRRKMLNHIRVWHELTVRRLRLFRETGQRPPPPGDEDSINAQAAADADLRTTAMIVSELDASLDRLRDGIMALRDDQLGAHEGWPVAVVAGNTWEHYAEHGADLEEETRGGGDIPGS